MLRCLTWWAGGGLIVPVSDKFLTATEVAARFSVSKRTVARWTKDGTIRSVQIGGVTRYPSSDLDRLTARAEDTA